MTTAAGRSAEPPILRLLATSSQIDDWADTLGRLRPGHLTVAHATGREAEAARLADRFGGTSTHMDRLDELAGSPGDLVLVVDAGRPQAVPRGTFHLRRLLHAGAMVWGITGPRPNIVADFCHDVVAVPVQESGLLLRCHQMVVERLAGRPRPSTGGTRASLERD